MQNPGTPIGEPSASTDGGSESDEEEGDRQEVQQLSDTSSSVVVLDSDNEEGRPDQEELPKQAGAVSPLFIPAIMVLSFFFQPRFC